MEEGMAADPQPLDRESRQKFMKLFHSTLSLSQPLLPDNFDIGSGLEPASARAVPRRSKSLSRSSLPSLSLGLHCRSLPPHVATRRCAAAAAAVAVVARRSAVPVRLARLPRSPSPCDGHGHATTHTLCEARRETSRFASGLPARLSSQMPANA